MRLSEDGLRVEFFFTNEEPELDAHVSFGLHPGFAVSSLDDCKVLLPEGTYVRYYAPGNFLDGRTEEIQFAGGEMPFAKAKLPDSYLLGLERVPARMIVLEDPNLGKRIAFDFSEVPFLPSGRTSRPTSASSRAGGCPTAIRQNRSSKKLGSRRIPPGESLTRGIFNLPWIFAMRFLLILIVRLMLLAVFTFGFVVLFEHGPAKFSEGARTEWNALLFLPGRFFPSRRTAPRPALSQPARRLRLLQFQPVLRRRRCRRRARTNQPATATPAPNR